MAVEIKGLLEAGAHFGHKSEKWNPKMKPFIFTKKSGIHVIDLIKTKEKLEEALDFIQKASSEGKIILFVGTKKQAQEIIKTEAEKAKMPYVVNRWLGGTLTNFQTVIKQVKKLNSLRSEKEEGEWNKFSKKEQAMKQKELERLEDTIGGLEDLKDLPDTLYIVDIVKENLALKEAKKLDIPVVGVVDSNSNPELVDYPIPANDDALKVIKLITEKVAEAISGVKPKKEETAEKKAPTLPDQSVGEVRVPTASVGKGEMPVQETKKEDQKKEQPSEEIVPKDEVEEIEEKLKEEIEEEEIEVKKAASAKTAGEKKLVKK